MLLVIESVSIPFCWRGKFWYFTGHEKRDGTDSTLKMSSASVTVRFFS